jgi:putative spermidine/putrescine transport system permease protein
MRPGRLLLWLYAGLVLLFLVLPILVIVPLSLSSGTFLYFPLPGLSLRWYARLIEHAPWRQTLLNSLLVGTIATLVATTLGTLAAFGLARSRFPGRGLVMALLLSPMIVPVIIVATGAYFFYDRLGLANSLLGLAIAHAALGAPFVLVTVSATLTGLDPSLPRAAIGLGAPPWTAFRRVTLPIIAPGVVSGALFAFVTSFDEVVVALFLTGPAQRTLPRQMFEGIREEISPEILAAATILVALAVLLLVAAELLRRRSARLRGIAP